MALRSTRALPIFSRLLLSRVLYSSSHLPSALLPPPLSPPSFVPPPSFSSPRPFSRRPRPPPSDDSEDEEPKDFVNPDLQDDEDPLNFSFFEDNGDGMAMPVLDDTEDESERP